MDKQPCNGLFGEIILQLGILKVAKNCPKLHVHFDLLNNAISNYPKSFLNKELSYFSCLKIKVHNNKKLYESYTSTFNAKTQRPITEHRHLRKGHQHTFLWVQQNFHTKYINSTI